MTAQEEGGTPRKKKSGITSQGEFPGNFSIQHKGGRAGGSAPLAKRRKGGGANLVRGPITEEEERKKKTKSKEGMPGLNSWGTDGGRDQEG